MRVYFATDRNLLPDNKFEMFGSGFNPDGVAALRFGHADFGPEGARPTVVDVYPEEAGQAEFKVLGSERFLKELHGCMAGAASIRQCTCAPGMASAAQGNVESTCTSCSRPAK